MTSAPGGGRVVVAAVTRVLNGSTGDDCRMSSALPSATRPSGSISRTSPTRARPASAAGERAAERAGADDRDGRHAWTIQGHRRLLAWLVDYAEAYGWHCYGRIEGDRAGDRARVPRSRDAGHDQRAQGRRSRGAAARALGAGPTCSPSARTCGTRPMRSASSTRPSAASAASTSWSTTPASASSPMSPTCRLDDWRQIIDTNLSGVFYCTPRGDSGDEGARRRVHHQHQQPGGQESVHRPAPPTARRRPA